MWDFLQDIHKYNFAKTIMGWVMKWYDQRGGPGTRKGPQEFQTWVARSAFCQITVHYTTSTDYSDNWLCDSSLFNPVVCWVLKALVLMLLCCSVWFHSGNPHKHSGLFSKPSLIPQNPTLTKETAFCARVTSRKHLNWLLPFTQVILLISDIVMASSDHLPKDLVQHLNTSHDLSVH